MMQKANMQPMADLDFDFQMPCRYFKSSFARSLSLNNNNASGNGNSNSNSLTLPKKTHTNEVKPQQQQHQQQQQQLQNLESLSLSHSLEGDSDLEESPCATPPPALPARRHTANLIHFDTATTPANQLLSPHPPQPPKSARNLNLVWSMQPTHQQSQPQTQQQQQQQQHLQDASIMAAPSHHHHHQHHHHNNIHSHIYDLPQQLQQHQQQHQPQQQQQQQHQLNVEAVILQNQVDTLHWQLKQTETNCEMYRAVMEEVARFFERYQQQQQLQQIHRNGEQIARSKSLHHVHGVGNNTSLQSDARDDDASSAGSASYLRARSSTNLMLNKSMHAMNEEHNYETIAPAGSYNAFKDFTWRRSPKKSGPNGGCKARLSSPEAAEEKLNQEAFRLARTIRNLLHTSEQQPDLTQPRHSLASISSLLPSGNHRLCKGKTSSVMTLLTPPLHNSTSIMNATLEAPSPAAKSNAELIFLRANNMRDSRLSLRSSTDSSVHSTISSTASSSSKVETDEDNNNTATTASNTAISNIKTSTSNKQSGSSTEDESGFSSISSFHDVGLPLSSTLMNGTTQRRLSMCSDSRNSTLKSGLNVVGLPMQSQSQSQTQIQVQVQAQITASQSPSKTYRNANRYQRFSTLSNEDAAAVLWV